ncbi:hypothetical protein Tco_0343774 [Tanacetum coccineum]
MAMKQRKRENNLMNWKCNVVIVITDSYDEVDLFEWEGVSLWEEDNNKNNEIGTNDIIVDEIVDEEIVRHEIVGDEIVDDGVPKEMVKRTNVPRIKITGKRRLYRLLDEDEDDEDIYGHV